MSDKDYRKNPSVGLPRSSDQAHYYLVYQAGRIWEENGEDPKQKGKAASEWVTRLAGLEPDIRGNPGVQALRDRGFDNAVKLFEKYYINGELV